MSKGWALTTFRQGFQAAKAGMPSSANPYLDRSDQAVVWQGGWLAGSSV